MTKEQKRFCVSSGVLLAAVIAVSQAVFMWLAPTDFPLRIATILIVALATCFTHFWLMKTVTEKPKDFNKIFFLLDTCRILLFLVCIVAYLIFFKDFGKIFILHFFVVYIIFAIFDVSLILKFVKK